jgi:hypothetical protein
MLSKMLPPIDCGAEINGEEIMTDAILSGVQALSVIFSDPAMGQAAHRHWNCEEFLQACPQLKSTLVELCPSTQGVLTDSRAFQAVADHARQSATANGYANRYVGVIITKPPETVCVFIPPLSRNTGSQHRLYYLYDPHSRPSLGLKSYLVETTDGGNLVERLLDLFPALPADDNDMGDSQGNLMNLMYNTFECNFFVCGIPISRARLCPVAAPVRPADNETKTAGTTSATTARAVQDPLLAESPVISTVPSIPAVTPSLSGPAERRPRGDSVNIVDDFVMVEQDTPVDSTVRASRDSNNGV